MGYRKFDAVSGWMIWSRQVELHGYDASNDGRAQPNGAEGRMPNRHGHLEVKLLGPASLINSWCTYPWIVSHGHKNPVCWRTPPFLGICSHCILLALREEENDIVYLITEMLFVVRHSWHPSGSEHLVAYRLPPDLTFGLSESSRSKSDSNGSKLEDKSHT